MGSQERTLEDVLRGIQVAEQALDTLSSEQSRLKSELCRLVRVAKDLMGLDEVFTFSSSPFIALHDMAAIRLYGYSSIRFTPLKPASSIQLQTEPIPAEACTDVPDDEPTAIREVEAA